ANLTLTWGQNYDRGFIGAGLEYFEQKVVRFRDREWTDQCATNYEVTTDGEIRRNDLFWEIARSQKETLCIPSRVAGRVIVPVAGSIYYTPGTSNGGWNNFSDDRLYAVPVDTDGDGVADISYTDYSPNGSEDQQSASLFPAQDRLSLFTYGEYTFDTDSNITAYFEAGYSKRNFETQSQQPQLFPFVPADNPWNICNPSGLPGFGGDCGLAIDELLLNNAGYRNDFFATYGANPEDFGLLEGPFGQVNGVRPVVAVRGDRNFTKTSVEQTRIVVGTTGDLPFNVSGVPDWTFDTWFSYTESIGKSSRSGIREDRLDQGLDAEVVNGQVVCRDTSNGCVPVNLFAPSLYAGVVGDFATQAERDFLFDSRDFDTTITQTLAHAFISGSLAQTDAGDIMFGIGAEYRVDEILSDPDDIARDGLFFGFFTDGGARGDRWVQEVFAELLIPLVKGQPLIEELTLELAGRYTQDEFYDAASTRSIKLGYRPVSSLLLRGTQGTSYRAPNLRELFLRGSTGFTTLFDPCAVPGDAFDPITGYNPALDTRDPQTLANCLANGVDPAVVNADNSSGTSFSTEVLTGGAQDITEERSTSETYGFSWRQPFSNEFELSIGATWYDISIDNTIISPGAQFIINDCYTNPTGISTFCSRISRDPATLELALVDQSFINRDNETASGVDVNVNFSTTLDTFGTAVSYSFDLVANHPHERSFTFIDEDSGQINFDDVVGEFGFPDWRANAQLGARWGDWGISWGIRYISSVEQDIDEVDPFSDINDTLGTGFFGDTCLGPDDGDVLCRDVGYAGSYITHSLSATYSAQTWQIRAGLSNVFDEAPPLVDGNEVLAVNNAPIGYGYDLNGQTAFVSFSTSF
ncbi:MAG: outer membrane cobalamin receptor protein, partial [Enterobacterales bacterium]|nr:outer membrane cobalamin receptor protein [Enterobacterales bacterium]